MSTSVADLVQPAAEMLSASDDDRIRFIRQPRWIGYSRARQILSRLDDLFHYPTTHRTPNLLIVGETNNGKTTLIKRFTKLHPPDERIEHDRSVFPVLSIQSPPVPEEGRLYNAILHLLGEPYRATEAAGRKQIQVLTVMRAVGVRLLILDEIHHLLAGSLARQRQFLNVLKYIGNEMCIPIVGVGTVEAIRAIATDPQLSNRFEPVALMRWEWNAELLNLLMSIERTLPLRRSSNLVERNLAAKLLSMSEGTIGEIHALLAMAAEYAIHSGTETINLGLLKEIPWVPPSERGRRAARMA